MRNLLPLAQTSNYTSAELLKGLEMAFAENCTGLYSAALRDVPERKRTLALFDETYDEICKRLGEEHKRLAERLVSLWSEMSGDELELTYLQGYIDCVALLRLIHII